MRWVTIIAIGTTFAGLLGCFPEKRVTWSPDGRRAAILGGDGLYISGETGRLSPRLADNVTRVAWLPDSRQLVLVRSQPARTWDDLAPLFTEDERAEIEVLAEDLRQQILAHPAGFESFDPEGLEDLSPGEVGAVLLFLRDRRAEGLPEHVGAKWRELEQTDVDIWLIQLADLGPAGADSGSASIGPPLMRLRDEVGQPRLSPDGGHIAFVSPAAEQEPVALTLYVAPLREGVEPRVVDEFVGLYPDWADKYTLVYAQSSRLSEGSLPGIGVIARRTVRDPDGNLLVRFGERAELAGILFQPEMRVRVIPSGEILFSAVEATFPCTPADLSDQASLFAVHPGRTPVVRRVVPRSAERRLCDAPHLFEPNPAGTRIAIPSSDGELCILDVAGGDVVPIVQSEQATGRLAMLPAWRNLNELTFIIAGPSAGKPAQLVLFTFSDAPENLAPVAQRVLSETWPPAVTRGLLTPDDEPDEPGELIDDTVGDMNADTPR